MKTRTITLAATLLASAGLAATLSQAQEKALEAAQPMPQEQAQPAAQEAAQEAAQAQPQEQVLPSAAQAAPQSPATARTAAPGRGAAVAAAEPTEVPAAAEAPPITRAEVQQAFQEARRFGMLSANGEIAEPDSVLTAREAFNERQTVALLQLTAERKAQWAAYHEAVARHAAWQREQELLATQQRSADDAAVAASPSGDARP